MAIEMDCGDRVDALKAELDCGMIEDCRGNCEGASEVPVRLISDPSIRRFIVAIVGVIDEVGAEEVEVNDSRDGSGDGDGAIGVGHTPVRAVEGEAGDGGDWGEEEEGKEEKRKEEG